MDAARPPNKLPLIRVFARIGSIPVFSCEINLSCTTGSKKSDAVVGSSIKHERGGLAAYPIFTLCRDGRLIKRDERAEQLTVKPKRARVARVYSMRESEGESLWRGKERGGEEREFRAATCDWKSATMLNHFRYTSRRV